MKLIPSGELLLVRPLKADSERKIKGIIIPVMGKMPPIGEIVAIPEHLKRKLKFEYGVDETSTIMYKVQTAVYSVAIDDEELHLMHYNNIMGVVEDYEPEVQQGPDTKTP